MCLFKNVLSSSLSSLKTMSQHAENLLGYKIMYVKEKAILLCAKKPALNLEFQYILLSRWPLMETGHLGST